MLKTEKTAGFYFLDISIVSIFFFFFALPLHFFVVLRRHIRVVRTNFLSRLSGELKSNKNNLLSVLLHSETSEKYIGV